MSDLQNELAALRIEREPDRPRRRGRVVWIVAFGVAAAVAVGAWRWGAQEHPIEVQTVAATARQAGAQASVLNASGYVTARRRATVSSKITGRVIEVNVEEGMSVTEGQVLARLDDTTMRAALALAEAQQEAARRAVLESEVRLEEARLTLARFKRLLEERVSAQAEVEAAQAQVDSLEARIAAARQQAHVEERQVELQRASLDDTVIRAPFSGVAISKDAQPGEMVSPVSAGGGFTRTGICTIVDMRSLEIEVDVNESYINRVKEGQPVTAILDAYPDWEVPARVITTVPTADRQKATVLVRIAFAELDSRILPDMGVKVTFLRPSDEGDAPAARPVVLVPPAAIRRENDQAYVFVARNGTVDRRAVATGGVDGDRIEVLAGLDAGEQVVVSPSPDLADGSVVAQ